VDRSLFGISLAQWLLLAASLLLPFVLFWTLAWLLSRLGRREDRSERAAFYATLWRGMRQPLVLALTLATHLGCLPWLGFSIEFRYTYGRLAMVAGVIILARLVWRTLSAGLERARVLALQRGRADTRSVILLGERVLKVVLIILALLVLLGLAGVDTSTALAGLGIGGIALALGAQKTVENLLGGILLLTDKALAVGDFCRVSDRLGWVEDVTLRSVRLRTVEQTLVSVPAGVVAQGTLENFSSRGKMLMQQMLRLHYQTTPAQLERVLAGLREMLAQHPKMERPGARAHLIRFGTQAIELELYAYFLTADQLEFLGLQEAVLLQAGTLVTTAGAGFADPIPAAAPGAA
jgi:MscS family membrane protein